jgi:BASS family bile acid:Na+ symporter
MAVIAWIVGIIVALNRGRFGSLGVVLTAVMAHNALGLILGCLGARQLEISESRRRTVSIEVEMQNSGLAVARSIAHCGPVAGVPGALFSVWHNSAGPLLAAIWRRRLP